MERLSEINKIYATCLTGDYEASGFYDASSYNYSFSPEEKLFASKLVANNFTNEEIAKILRLRYWSFSNI